ncbi:hypothetical protein NMY22_g12437 [Coprinellus aureogranulatus]|nr:hypothetical protein NMY22_g12437 [Coprinellus aureogranulatus]
MPPKRRAALPGKGTDEARKVQKARKMSAKSSHKHYHSNLAESRHKSRISSKAYRDRKKRERLMRENAGTSPSESPPESPVPRPESPDPDRPLSPLSCSSPLRTSPEPMQLSDTPCKDAGHEALEDYASYLWTSMQRHRYRIDELLSYPPIVPMRPPRHVELQMLEWQRRRFVARGMEWAPPESLPNCHSNRGIEDEREALD